MSNFVILVPWRFSPTHIVCPGSNTPKRTLAQDHGRLDSASAPFV